MDLMHLNAKRFIRANDDFPVNKGTLHLPRDETVAKRRSLYFQEHIKSLESSKCKATCYPALCRPSDLGSKPIGHVSLFCLTCRVFSFFPFNLGQH